MEPRNYFKKWIIFYWGRYQKLSGQGPAIIKTLIKYRWSFVNWIIPDHERALGKWKMRSNGYGRISNRRIRRSVKDKMRTLRIKWKWCRPRCCVLRSQTRSHHSSVMQMKQESWTLQKDCFILSVINGHLFFQKFSVFSI